MAMIAAACGGTSTTTTTAGGGATTTAGGEMTTTTAGGEMTTTTAGGSMVDVSGTEFTLFGAPTGAEGDAMTGFVNVYNQNKGTNISYVGSDDFENQIQIRVEGGDPPAVAFTPQPGTICKFADEGKLVSLEDLGFDIAQLESDSGKFWMDLGICKDGKHYGLPWFPNYKSLVWYVKPVFDQQGYEIPTTWQGLLDLSQKMVDDGYTPWCFGFESGNATGWPGTDWVEDIYVRESGADMYTKWFKHEIPFNDPSVAKALNTFGDLFFAPNFVLGGTSNVSSVNFKDAPLPMFNTPPGCLMHKQGSFVTNFFPAGGEDIVKFFPFPTIDGNDGALGGGDTIMVFKNDPKIAQILKDWVSADWECTLASPSGGGVSPYGGTGVAGVERLPGNKNVSPDCYETDTNKTLAKVITDALASNSFVFDASDLMPPEVGQGTWWKGMVDWANGTPTQQVLDTVEASWPSS
jgi:alpha-glucoside transport system substrate-binding protein